MPTLVQAAVLSKLVKKINTLEIVPSLALKAEQLLKELGYDNVEISRGDGSLGWRVHAPFDGIIVTAAADQIPQALKDQLKPGGRLVIPVGRPNIHQELLLVQKDAKGGFTQRKILPVAFFPFTGELNSDGNLE